MQIKAHGNLSKYISIWKGLICQSSVDTSVQLLIPDHKINIAVLSHVFATKIILYNMEVNREKEKL